MVGFTYSLGPTIGQWKYWYKNISGNGWYGAASENFNTWYKNGMKTYKDTETAVNYVYAASFRSLSDITTLTSSGEIMFTNLLTKKDLLHDSQLGFTNSLMASVTGGPGLEFFAGALMSATSELYYSERYGIWMGKNFKLYSHTWGGNGTTGGKNKYAKNTHNTIKWAGRVLGAWNAYSITKQRMSGEITNKQLILEQSSNTISTLGGPYGAAWGVGWEIGRSITNTGWYQEVKFNYFYSRWESRVGPPTKSNESYWMLFYQNYNP